MASHAKAAHQLARQLFQLSVVDGAVATERVGGVLEYVERHAVANPVMVWLLRPPLRFEEVGRPAKPPNIAAKLGPPR